MRFSILLSLAFVALLAAIACNSGGGGSPGTDPGGIFGDDDPEITICHEPSDLGQTLVIPFADLAPHMAHGDTEGECPTDGHERNDGRGDDGDDGDDEDDGDDRRAGRSTDGDDDDDDDDDF